MTLQSKTSQVSLQWLRSLQEKRSLPFLAQWLCNSLKYFRAVWPIQWNKQARFLTAAMLSLILLCVTAALMFLFSFIYCFKIYCNFYVLTF